MLDTLRTLLLAAVGAVDLTEDKVRSIADELVRRGTLAADEAKTVMAEWAQAAARRREGTDERIRLAVDEALGRHNVASHGSVVDLEVRVAALEEALRRLTLPRM